MSVEYTPSEGDIRGRHAAGWLSRGWPETTEIDAEFDRWLAAHDAQVRRTALADAAIVFGRAAATHERDPETCEHGGFLGRAYREGERVLTAWADDPTCMDGHLRRHRIEREGGEGE